MSKEKPVTPNQCYGRGFNKSNLYMFVQFFTDYPQIFQSVIGKSGQKQLGSCLLKQLH